MTILIIIILIFSGLIITFWDTEFSFFLQNKYIKVSIINLDKEPQKYGDSLQMEQSIKLRFLWTTKIKSYSDIKLIKAFETVDFGLENNFKHLELFFKNNDKVKLDVNEPTHREFIDKILIEFSKQPFAWENEFATYNDKNRKDILYENNN